MRYRKLMAWYCSKVAIDTDRFHSSGTFCLFQTLFWLFFCFSLIPCSNTKNDCKFYGYRYDYQNAG